MRIGVGLGSAGLVLAVAAACAFALQYSTHLDWERRSSMAITLSFVDVLVIAVLITFVWSVIGRLWLSLGIVSAATVVLAVANQAKVRQRFEPLYPSDRDFIADVGFLASMVDTGTVVSAVSGVLAVLIGLAVVGWLVGRWIPRPRMRRPDGTLNAGFVEVRLLVFVLTAGLLAHATDFNRSPNLWRSMYDSNGESWRPWSQLQNVHDNGFVGGFLYNMPIDPMASPESYDAERMERIARRYSERADEINADRDGSLGDVNVVFVLSESFTDPERLDGFTLERDPIPNIREVMGQTIAGNMYAQQYGGGTATMEFESLTGQSVGLFRPQVSSPYQMFVSDMASYPSVVGTFEAMGHRTVAIHPYTMYMYKRSDVYETLGFDDVIDESQMGSTQRLDRARYVSDQAAYSEVLRAIDAGDDPAFVNLVTMQNHGAYGDIYDDPIGTDIADPGQAAEIGDYARGLEYTDRATTAFLGELQRREETTIVVFYGDHHPGVYGDDIVDANDVEDLHRTPFFVWNSADNEAGYVEATNPTALIPLVYEAADAPVPPYVALLEDMRGSFGALYHGRNFDPEGRPLDLAELGGRPEELLDDMRLVQYDFAVGERYAVDEMWPGADG